LRFYIYSDLYLFPTRLAIAQSNIPLPLTVSIEQAISVKMTNVNSVYINFFNVNLSGSQGEIRLPAAEKKSMTDA
jgi:hypothetical protein